MSINILGSIKQSRFLVFLACLLGACSLASCKARPPQAAAKVNGDLIAASDLVTELMKAGSSLLTSKTDRIKMGHVILDRLIEERLILQAAELASINIKDNELKHALQQDAQFYPQTALRKSLHEKYLTLDKYQEQLKRTMVIEKYLQQELSKFKRPSIAQLKKEKAWLLPKRIHARQILLQSKEEARFVIAKISQEKMPFETAARRYSIAPEAENGGDLGWFQQKQLPPIFDYCFALKKMQVSEVMVSQYGYHIFQVTNIEAARSETPLELKNRVQERLKHEYEQNSIKQIIDRLRKKAHIEVNEEDFMQIITSMPEKLGT